MGKQRYAFKMAGMYESLEVDPQAVGEELEALIDGKNEHVTPDEIIAAARKRESAMNRAFTWDQEEAAFNWNRRQAKQLTNHLVLEKDGKPSKTRGFVYVHHPEHGGKKVLLSTRSAMARPEMREQVIEQAVRMLQRSLNFWGSMYGGNASLRKLARDVRKLHDRAERELLQAI